MTVYKAKRSLTIEESGANTPQEALAHAISSASQILSGDVRLVSADIRQTFNIGNSYDIEATFTNGAH